MTLASVSGGDCAGATLQAAVGRRDMVTTAIHQNGSSLSAEVTSLGNGTTCSFSGSTGGGTIALALTSCQSGQAGPIQCADGTTRTLQLAAENVSGTVSNGAGSGTDVSTWNVLRSGFPSPVSVLTLSTTFTWIEDGLPASNFHNFTGTVAPGYQDGVITIGPPEPFCTACGWFR